MTAILPFPLYTTPRVKWTTTQEKTINREYPFTLLGEGVQETPDQYVVRTYLQFLWLPESIMPLSLLIPSFRRVSPNETHPSAQGDHPETYARPHPLHALLQPLFLSVRTSAAKYHTELPQILANNGGAGEIEEGMMWFASAYEKFEDKDSDDKGGVNGAGMGMNDDLKEDAEERWRRKWLERLERREIQIQILLYLLKLSLPGPQLPLPPVEVPIPPTSSISVLPTPSTISEETPTASSAAHKKRKIKKKAKTIIPSATERLESFMDKLSMWQLLRSVDTDPAIRGGGGPGSQRNENNADGGRGKEREMDWMQTFCEETVEPQFKSSLPDMCALLRDKIFPHSSLPDDPSDASKATGSKSKSKNKPGSSNIISRSKSTADTNATSTKAKSKVTTTSEASRARSRSLSVSLALDQQQQETRTSTSTIKRAMSREVSMSRGFKPKGSGASKGGNGSGRQTQDNMDVEPVNVKGKQKSDPRISSSGAITLVAATPTKPRVRQLKRSNTGVTTSRTLVGSPSPGPGLSLDVNIGADNPDEDQSSSPYSLRLGMGTSSGSGSSPGFYSGGRSSAADDVGAEGEVDTDIEENGDTSRENTIMDLDKDEEEIWLPSSSPDILLLGISPLRPRAQPGAKAKLFDPSPSPPASPLAPKSKVTTTSEASRARSRSLSVSLALDQQQQETRTSTSTIKRAMSREVSMSRGFKPKGSGASKGGNGSGRQTQDNMDVEPVNVKGKQKSDPRISSSGAITLVAATPTKPRVRQLKRSNTGVTTSRTLVGSPSPGPSLSLDVDIGADNPDEDQSSSPYSLRLGMGTSSGSGSSPGFYSGGRSSAADDVGAEGEVDTDIEENGDTSRENTIMDLDKDEEEIWLPSSSPDILLLGISPLRPRAQPGAKAKLFDPSPSPPASPLARSAGRNEARSLKRIASASMDTGAERAFDDAPTKAGSGLHAGKRTRIR
ncbi:hypothetical protein BJ138DRAFT_1117498 [Hygrophoropsis aurantiaca]|uniref:Uncharacterized protein n=1 Tax=Hygrophoropsis aurantiaca TaxID=72124 RepID=A0ACB8A0E3_9AGAM|nr:hypothetical protein BJ138DRAFT_1117498 [Hygrophoropsis aurantiaca]